VKAFAVLVCLAATACAAPAAWINPDLDPGRWPLDRAECRSRAEAKAEKEYRRDQDIGQPGQWRSAMAKFDAEKRARSLTILCLQAKGYAKAVKDGG
jgi:hypothetical protein